MNLADRSSLQGYVNPLRLPNDPLDVLTTNGEHREIPLREVRAVYFVRDFTEDYQPERKAFLSRPKLDGLWVRLKFRDGETLEGVVTNDLLALLDGGIQITPPDLNGTAVRIFVPRAALSEVTVLGRGGGGAPQARPGGVAGAAQAFFRVRRDTLAAGARGQAARGGNFRRGVRVDATPAKKRRIAVKGIAESRTRIGSMGWRKRSEAWAR